MQPRPGGRWTEGRVDRPAGHRGQIVERPAEVFCCLGELAAEVDAEIAGVVGRERDRNPRGDETGDRMRSQIRVEVDEVRGQAHVERHTVLGQPLHHFGVVRGPDAVVDPVHHEQVERRQHTVCAGRLAGVRRPAEPDLTGPSIGVHEALSAMACGRFVPVDRETEHAGRAVSLDPLDERVGLGRCLAPQDREEEMALGEALSLRAFETVGDRVDERTELPGRPMGGVHDDLGVHDPGRAGRGRVVVRELGREFRRAHQRTGPVEEVEERAQARKLEELLRRARQRLSRSGGQLADPTCIECALEVHV